MTIDQRPVEDDLRDLLVAEARDVCTADEALARSRLHSSEDVGGHRATTVLSAVAAVLLVVAVASVVLAVSHGRRGDHAAATPSTALVVPSPHPVSTRGWVTFRNDDQRFTVRYPRRWHARYFADDQESFGGSVADLSTQTLHDPRVRTYQNGQLRSQNCALPLSRMGRRDVLVMWSEFGFPTSMDESFRSSPGRVTTVDGRPAHLYVGRAKRACSDLTGAVASVIATIRLGSAAQATMDACLGPDDLAEHESQVLAMLRTATFR